MRQTGLWVFCLVSLLVSGCGCKSVVSEKQVARPMSVPYSVADRSFANSMGNLLGAPLVAGNSVVQLVNGDQIFPAMLKEIRVAQKTITLETFIWAPGQVSTQFITAICERSRAGVKVHVIVDALGSGKMEERDIKQMTSAGVDYLEYNKTPVINVFRSNHRTHRKIMVVDGRVGFTGGVCISDDWSGNAETNHWRDSQFRLEGPVVSQLQAVFMENWLQLRSEVLHGDSYFPEQKPAGPMVTQFFKSGPGEGTENSRLAYLLSIGAARKHIRLAHAQFVPNDTLIEALLAARRRGVKVEVIVPARSDNRLVSKGSRGRWSELLDGGVEFYEYQPTFFHCKTMIVDDLWVTTGSVNFDERSFRINDEGNLNVLNADFGAQMIETFEQDKSKSRVLTAKDFEERGWFRKAVEGFVGLFHSQL